VKVIREITEEGFVRDLFQPKEDTRLAFRIGLRIATSPRPYPRRLARAGWDVVSGRKRWLVAGSATLPGATASWKTPTWCLGAMGVSDVLIGEATRLGDADLPDFEEGAPRPTPTLRIVPLA